MKETRLLNISFQASKGAKGGPSARMAIPITWLREMGVTESERQVSVQFDGEKIIIQKTSNTLQK